MTVPLLTSIVPRALAVLDVVSEPVRKIGLYLQGPGPGLPEATANALLDMAAVALGYSYTYAPYLFLGFWVALENVTDTQVSAARDAGAGAIELIRWLFWPSVRRLAGGVGMLATVLMTLDIVVPALLGDGKVLYVGPAVEFVFFRLRNRPAAVALMLLSILVALSVGLAVLGVVVLVRRLSSRSACRSVARIQASG